MHEFAPRRALIHPPHAIAEPNQDALLEGLILHLARLDIQTFFFCDSQELFMQRANLARRNTMDAGFAKSIHPKLILRRVIPRPHQNPEVRPAFAAEQIIT